jgi:arylsulfatase A-like enzyme
MKSLPCKLLTAAFSIGISTLASLAAPASRPNIVWIFSDDHSFQTIGAYGGILKGLNMTPNIDRLAAEGMRFDRCYVGNSICGPSRATLLTGKHSHKNGMLVNEGGTFDHNQPQFQKVIQASGYQTALVGKIHLNGSMQGFDYWDVLPGQGDYYNPKFISADGKNENKGYVTHITTDKAMDWMKHKRDPEKPFMLMIHHKAAHRTWIPAAKDMTLYKDVTIPEPANLFDDYATRTSAAQQQEMSIGKDMLLDRDLKVGPMKKSDGYEPTLFEDRNRDFEAKALSGKELVRWKYQEYMKDYLRCVWAVDESVGQVMATLKEMGLDQNTIVMYSSDQGFYMGEHGWFDKRFMYEESFRTPLIARWPGRIKPASVNADLVQNIDFAETFLDLAGAPIPADMQGHSLLPLLKGETPGDWRKSLYYHYYEFPKPHRVPAHEGVFDGQQKLIRFYGEGVKNGEEWEFYDLKNDPSEMNNRYDKPDTEADVSRMKKELARFRTVYEVPAATP